MVDEPEAPHGTSSADVLEPGAPRQPLGLQGTLFDDLPEDQRPGGSAQDVGYRGPTACSAAGVLANWMSR